MTKHTVHVSQVLNYEIEVEAASLEVAVEHVYSDLLKEGEVNPDDVPGLVFTGSTDWDVS